MIDLHIHVLPAVDDGPDELDEAARMCVLAAEDGCTHLVATPHQRCERWWNTDPVRLRKRRDELEAAIAGAIDLRLGAEIRVDHGFVEDLRGMPSTGLLPLAGSRYMLVEFDRAGAGPEPESILDELIAAGWRPIVAHPEFVPQFVEDPVRLRDAVRAGAHAQVTAASLVGRFGRPVQRFALDLVDEEIAAFVASDGHGTSWRPPGLRAARDLIAHRWGERRAEALTRAHPEAVLADEPLPG